MNIFKRLLLSFYVVVLCALVCMPGVQAGSKIPLKGLFKVLKTDDIGFGHSLLHSGAIENMYQFAPGKAKNKENGYKGKSEGDFVADLVRSLWFRVQEDFQLNPTQQGALLGLDGKIFGQLMNYIYSGQIYYNELIKGKRSSRGKVLEIGFVNIWHDRCKEIAKNISGVSACSLKKVVLLVDTISKSLDFCKKEQQYKERIVQGILWAFFFHKLKDLNFDAKIKEINASLGQIDKKYKDNSEALRECYCKKDLYNFEQKIKELNEESQLNIMSKEYDVTLHYLLNKLVGKYPSVISQGNYPYEYEKGKFSTSRPNCYETALLDLFSILWHNPSKGCYDNSLLPKELLDGKGFTRLRQALKSLSVAENNKIRSEQYSYDIGGKKYSSLIKLRDIIKDKKLKDQVDKLKIEDVNTSYINRAEINQEWFNIVSNIKGVEYHSEVECKKIFEVNPGVKNFIKIFNYFYGTDAKSVDELGGLISTDSRTITFKKTKKEDAPNEIEIDVDDKENCFNFNVTVNIMTGHVELKVPGREGSKSKIIKEGVSKVLLKNIDSKNIKNINILTLLANQNLLEEKIKWDASTLNQIYYSLLLKDASIKLDVIKDILSRPMDVYNQLENLVYNLINALPDDEYIIVDFLEFIFSVEKYKNDNKLKECVSKTGYIKKYAHSILHKVIGRGNKEDLKIVQFLFLEGVDVNHSKYNFTPLTYAILRNRKDIVKLLLEHKNIDVNKKDCSNNIPLVYSIGIGKNDIAKLLLVHKDIDINNGASLTRVYSKELMELFLSHENIDINKGNVLGRAIKKGYKEIVERILSKNVEKETFRKAFKSACEVNSLEYVKLFLDEKCPSLKEDKKLMEECLLEALIGESKVKSKGKRAQNVFNYLLDKKIKPGRLFYEFLLKKIPYKNIGIEFVLDKSGIDINKRYKDLNSVFLVAVGGTSDMPGIISSIEDEDLVGMLIGRGIDVNVRSRTGITGLMVSISKGYSEVAKLILNKSSTKVNLVSDRGKHALNSALKRGFVDIAKKIISHKSIEEGIEKVNWLQSLEKAQKLLKKRKYKDKVEDLKEIIVFIENKIEQVKELKKKK